MSIRDDVDRLITRLARYATDADRWAEHEELLEISDFFRGRASAFLQSANFIKAVLKQYPKVKEKEPE